MTAVTLAVRAEPWWNPTRSRAFLVATHVPFLAVAPTITITGFVGSPQPAWLVLPLALAIGALQLRHSLAAARGTTPTAWPLSLAALALLVYLPLPFFGFDWASMQWMCIASAAMLLRGGIRRFVVSLPLLGTMIWQATVDAVHSFPAVYGVADVLQWLVALAGAGACLYATSQLVRAVDVLFGTRAELAELAVGRERRRVSRDLHDLLAQTLTAISLKGDLAMSLLRSGARSAAETEVRDLTDLARAAMQDVREVVYDEHSVSLQGEIEAAAELLKEAGIATRIDVEPMKLSRPDDELLGWAVREGVANVLRHSNAARCAITATRRNGEVELAIANDGAGPQETPGGGIQGLTERAQARSGHVTAGRQRDGSFLLCVSVPRHGA